MCDCTQYPFQPDPPCFETCGAAFLNAASAEELVSVLGLSRHVAEVVDGVGRGMHITSFGDLEPSLVRYGLSIKVVEDALRERGASVAEWHRWKVQQQSGGDVSQQPGRYESA